MSVIINIRVPKNAENSLTTLGTARFSPRKLFYGFGQSVSQSVSDLFS